MSRTRSAYPRGMKDSSEANSPSTVKYANNLLESVGLPIQKPTTIMADNQSAIALTHTTKFHDRSKHIEIRFHAIRYYVRNGEIKYQYVSTDEMLADIGTKALGRVKFEKFRSMLNVRDIATLRGSIVIR